MVQGVGVALSGGSIYGAVHAGVLRALSELGVRVEALAGTSAGAIVATLYAFRAYDPAAPPDPRAWRIVDPRWWGWPFASLIRNRSSGLLRLAPLMRYVREEVGDVPLRRSPLPLAVVATDLATGQPAVFASVERPSVGLGDAEAPAEVAVGASCAVPLLFEPVRWHGRLLVDGGLSDNLPVRWVRLLGAERVLAVDFGGIPASLRSGGRAGFLDVLQATVYHVTHRRSADPLDEPDLLLRPEVPVVRRPDRRSMQRLADCGYRAAMAEAEAIRRLAD